MRNNHESDIQHAPVIQRVEKYHAPERVQQNKTEASCRAGYEKHLGPRFQAHGGGSDRIRHDVHQGKRAADDPEAQPADVRQNVLVLNEMRAVIGDLLESTLGFPQDLVDEVPEAFLEQHGEHEPERELPAQGHDYEPPQRGQQQGQQPEEGGCNQDDDSDRVVGYREREHGEWRPEGQEGAAEELCHRHFGRFINLEGSVARF